MSEAFGSFVRKLLWLSVALCAAAAPLQAHTESSAAGPPSNGGEVSDAFDGFTLDPGADPPRDPQSDSGFAAPGIDGPPGPEESSYEGRLPGAQARPRGARSAGVHPRGLASLAVVRGLHLLHCGRWSGDLDLPPPSRTDV